MKSRTDKATAYEHIGRDGLIVIIRAQFTLEELLFLGESLVTVGNSVMEVTLNSPRALEALSHLRKKLGSAALVGAGTVRNATQWMDAFNAGAQFTVAPNLELETLQTAASHNVLHIPGVFTATEAEVAHARGSQLLKLFPARLGGPSYLQALKGPLDDLQFVPTGGISADNAAAFRRAGAFALGVGAISAKSSIDSIDKIIARLSSIRQAWVEGGNH